MTPLQWISRFHHADGRGRSDGRPLCAYRCKRQEFDELQGLLRAACAGCTQARSLAPGVEPLLCLYAAEWWRRNYKGGPWAWEPVLSGVGLQSLHLQQLYYMVELGLRYWKRPLLVTGAGRGFLLTLACEGGLPLQLVHREGTKLRAYFKALLDEFQIFSRAGVAPSDLAARVGHYLPKSLRQGVVYSVSGELVRAVWEIQQRHVEQGISVAQLDRTAPGWRGKLPLAIEDHTAEALLGNLIQDASQLVSGAADAIKVQRFLLKTDGGWTLHATVGLPDRLVQQSLATELPDGNEILGKRLELYARSAAGDETLLAFATPDRAGDSPKFIIEPVGRGLRAIGADSVGEIQIWLGTAQRRFGPLVVPGTEAPSDLPWGFVERPTGSERLELLGEGSLRSRHPVVWVAAGEDWEASVEEGACVLDGQEEATGRRLWRVEGVGAFRDDDGNLCRVRTRQPEDRAVAHRLTGSHLPYTTDGARGFLGAPKCYEVAPSGAVAEVPAHELEWRLVGTGRTWSQGACPGYGTVQLRRAVEGETVFRTKVSVLPPDFAVRFVPGASIGDGSLKFTAIADAMPSWTRQDGVSVECTEEGLRDGFAIAFRAVGEPPVSVRLTLGWPRSGSCELELPFPARGGRFVTRAGQPLKGGASVPLERLGSVEALATSYAPTDRFSVTGALNARDLSSDQTHSLALFLPLKHDATGRHSFSMGSLAELLRNMFASTTDIGAQFSLEIVGPSSSGKRLHVRRFDMAFEPNRDTGVVMLDCHVRNDLEPAPPERLQVEAYPLWDPWQEPVRFDQDHAAEGGWRVPADLDEGPWLVVGWDGDWCRVQPMVWNVDGRGERSQQLADAAEAPSESLAQAVRIRDPDQRQDALDGVLGGLAVNPDHSDWDALMQYVQTFQGMPATTLDVMDRLVEHPTVLAQLLMRADEGIFGTLCRMFDDLPFSWHAMAMDAWTEAAQSLAQSLRTKLAQLGLDEEALLSAAFRTFLNRAPQVYPHFSLVAERVRLAANLPPEPAQQALEEARMTLALAQTPPGKVALQVLFKEAEQDLLHIHADSTWPQGHHVMEWAPRIKALPQELVSLWIESQPGTGYRAPVLNAPVVAALCSRCGIPPDPGLTYEIRALRAFEPRWFDEAHRLTLTIAMATHHAECGDGIDETDGAPSEGVET